MTSPHQSVQHICFKSTRDIVLCAKKCFYLVCSVYPCFYDSTAYRRLLQNAVEQRLYNWRIASLQRRSFFTSQQRKSFFESMFQEDDKGLHHHSPALSSLMLIWHVVWGPNVNNIRTRFLWAPCFLRCFPGYKEPRVLFITVFNKLTRVIDHYNITYNINLWMEATT